MTLTYRAMNRVTAACRHFCRGDVFVGVSGSCTAESRRPSTHRCVDADTLARAIHRDRVVYLYKSPREIVPKDVLAMA